MTVGRIIEAIAVAAVIIMIGQQVDQEHITETKSIEKVELDRPVALNDALLRLV